MEGGINILICAWQGNYYYKEETTYKRLAVQYFLGATFSFGRYIYAVICYNMVV